MFAPKTLEADASGRGQRRAAYLGLALVIVLSLAGIFALTRPASTLPSRLAAAFSLPGPGGATVSVAAPPGRATVIAFWATWCPSCRTDLPRLAGRARSAGVRVVMVDEFESAATATAWLQNNGVGGTLALDQSGSVASRYQVIGLPTTLFVSADGKIESRVVGAMSDAQISAGLEAIRAPAA